MRSLVLFEFLAKFLLNPPDFVGHFVFFSSLCRVNLGEGVDVSLDLFNVNRVLGAHALDRVKFVLNTTHSGAERINFLVNDGKLLVEDRLQVLDCTINGLLEHGDCALPLVAAILILWLGNSEISVDQMFVFDN